MNMLSGCELVEKGTTKIDATLPELGVKEVTPNGTWLEQKQVQAAMEARKKLIEVERIEKCGALSHAEWDDNLKLAGVTQKVGGHWQYLGHNIGKQLYIRAEEVLFLMELNCLHLKFNNVQVSLQQAYSLFLGHEISHQQYKVFASLSRLGYRVYQHETLANEININPGTSSDNREGNCSSAEKTGDSLLISKVNIKVEKMDVLENIQIKQEPDTEENYTENINYDIQNIPIKKENTHSDDTEVKASSSTQDDTQLRQKNDCCQKKLQNLKNRKLKPCNSKTVLKYFNNLPEFLGATTVIIKKPNIMYIPINVILKRVEYTVNLLNIREKGVRTDTSEANIYNAGDEVNGSHVRRLDNSTDNNTPGQFNNRFPSQNTQYRPYNMWRDRHSFNYFNFNMFFQRNLGPSWYSNSNCQFIPRNHACPRPTLSLNSLNFRTTPNSRKRPKNNTQKQHLDGIKRLSAKLKLLLQKGNTDSINIQSLQKLIHLYNKRYKARLRITPDFDIIDENVLDTIDLDDDEPSGQRRKSDDHERVFKENLEQLKQLASKLKNLEGIKKSTARHRRALSKLLKIFNESYQEEYYLSDDYDIKNPKHISLDTSESESDCCVSEDSPSLPKRKKLKNPFNVLKRLSEKQKDGTTASTSDDCEVPEFKKYSDVLVKTFSKGWLPREDDFGRAEVVKKDCINNACAHDEKDLRREEFMYDFLKIQSTKSENWLNLKISFYQSFNEAMAEFQGKMHALRQISASTVKSEDNSMASVLRKLSVIGRDDSLNEECNLKIDFDVYNRDVKKFKKTNRPTPHFRLIVLDESSTVPSGTEIATLKSKYDDDVDIVFAIVGMNSIGYIQVKPTVLPVYLRNES